MAETFKGVVKWFNDAKGFGFIEHTNGQDVFVHYSVIQTEGFRTLKDGEQVQYELSQGDKGLHAAAVFRDENNIKKPTKKPTEIAPNLESGSVNTAVQSMNSMIEMEKVLETDSNNIGILDKENESKEIGK